MTKLMEPAEQVLTTRATTSASPVSQKALWTGRVISTLIVLMLLMSSIFKFKPPEMAVKENARLGWSMSLAPKLAVLEVAVAVLYAIPQTAVLGAILLTGYLGGATATHVRVGDPFIMPVILGVLAWVGLYLRDPRLRPLAPWRRL
jgi:hypothetical protein